MMNGAIIISDLHLGSRLSQVSQIIEILRRIKRSEIQTRRLNKRHLKVLSLIRTLSKRLSITWVGGSAIRPRKFIPGS